MSERGGEKTDKRAKKKAWSLKNDVSADISLITVPLKRASQKQTE